jgi:hypothetical protein
MKRLFPTFSILAVSSIIDVCVTATLTATHFLSLPQYTVILYVHLFESYVCQIFIPNHLCFFVYSLTLHLKSTMTSMTAKCSVGLYCLEHASLSFQISFSFSQLIHQFTCVVTKVQKSQHIKESVCHFFL